jgi:hypothetical protein
MGDLEGELAQLRLLNSMEPPPHLVPCGPDTVRIMLVSASMNHGLIEDAADVATQLQAARNERDLIDLTGRNRNQDFHDMMLGVSGNCFDCCGEYMDICNCNVMFGLVAFLFMIAEFQILQKRSLSRERGRWLCGSCRRGVQGG